MSEWSKKYPYTDSNVDIYVPTTGGVYRLIYGSDDEYQVFYVGQSEDLQGRLHDHLNPSERDECIKRHLRDYSCYFRFIEIASETDRDKVEEEEIEEYKPPCNG